MPKVIKSNGNREPFDEDKMVGGIQRALEKRPVSADSIELAISMISRNSAQLVSVKYRAK